MSHHDLNRLCAVYHNFRAAGFPKPDAWRFANEYLSDQPKRGKA